MCIYAGGHNADKEIHVRISDKPENIRKFGTDIVLRSSGKTCYSQILQYNGKYYLFYRVDNKNWAYRVSSDGVSWMDEVILKKISYGKFSIIINKPECLTQRMFDVAITEPSKPRILYAVFLANKSLKASTYKLYDYAGGKVRLPESVYTEKVGKNYTRNARPIADINGKAFLWHRGYYNPNSYKDFYTEAKFYFMP